MEAVELPQCDLDPRSELDIAQLCVVSPRTPDGDILKYLNKHPGANRETITRVHAFPRRGAY